MRFTRENTPEADVDDLRKMNERYYLIVDSVKVDAFTSRFLEKLAEVVKEEVMVGKRLKEAFEAYQNKDKEKDGEGGQEG